MLLQKLKDDLTKALKSGDVMRTSVLRMTLSALNYEFINKQHDLSEEEILGVLQHEAKKHRESIESFKLGNREDLWKKEEAELVILQSYLPTQMNKEDVKKEVSIILSSINAEDKKNFGKVMSVVMGQLKGKADGSVVSQAVKELVGQ